MKKLFLSILILTAIASKAQVQVYQLPAAPQLRDSTLFMVSHGRVLKSVRKDSVDAAIGRSLCSPCNAIDSTRRSRDSVYAHHASGVWRFQYIDTTGTIITGSNNQIAFKNQHGNYVTSNNLQWNDTNYHFIAGDWSSNINGTFFDLEDSLNSISMGDGDGSSGIYWYGPNSSNTSNAFSGLYINAARKKYWLGDVAGNGDSTSVLVNDSAKTITLYANSQPVNINNDSLHVVALASSADTAGFYIMRPNSTGDSTYGDKHGFFIDLHPTLTYPTISYFMGRPNINLSPTCPANYFSLEENSNSDLYIGGHSAFTMGPIFGHYTIGDLDGVYNGTTLDVYDGDTSVVFSKPKINIGGQNLIFPSSTGALNSALTNDGVGNLSWTVIDAAGVVSGSDFTTTALTGRDITGLSFAVLAGQSWEFTADLKVGSSTNTGVKIAVNTPATPTSLNAYVQGQTLTNGTLAEEELTGDGTLTGTAFNTLSATTSATGAFVHVRGFVNASNSGDVFIQIAKVTSGTATVYQGSHLRATRKF